MSEKPHLLVGKTIQSVEPRFLNERGESDTARIALYFTDGTMAEIIGDGDDCDDWVDLTELYPVGLAERQQEATNRQREEQELKAKYEAWMALTCEEREKQLAPSTPFISLLSDFYDDHVRRQLETVMPWYATPEREIKDRCPKCREYECPNSPVRVIPAKPGLGNYQHIYVDPGQPRTKARRS